MKLSFSLSSKTQPKKPSTTTTAATAAAAAATITPTAKEYLTAFESSENTQTTKEYVTEFDPSKPPTKSNSKIIPPKPNEWQPYKKMKNLQLPLTQDSNNPNNQPLQFEVDTGSNVEPGSDSISYGLNIRQQILNEEEEEEGSGMKPPPGVDPLLFKFKEDLKCLPEGNGLDDYDDVPVEGFGAALLGGYGWKEGRGIGRNPKEDVKIVEFKKWSGKEGLGFTGEGPGNLTGGKDSKKDTRVGENVGVVNDRGVGNNGRREEKGGLHVGKEVRVVNGREMGMKGRVLEVKSGGEMVVLRLSRSEEDVVVRSGDVAELGSVEEERCLRRLKELKIKEKDESSGRERRGKERERDSSSRRSYRESKDVEVKDRRKEGKYRESEDVEMKDRKKESERGREELRESGKVRWLTSHIRVRIVSKELKGGRLYLKKGEVLDVVGPTTCDISMDDSRELIQGVDQELLETALPKRGGSVLVLYGRHKGVYGKLVEKDTEKETGVVRDADTHELLNVQLEQIAEYIGDPSYIGY